MCKEKWCREKAWEIGKICREETSEALTDEAIYKALAEAYDKGWEDHLDYSDPRD